MYSTQPAQPAVAGAPRSLSTLEEAVQVYLEALAGRNRSAATIQSYGSDLVGFVRFLHETNVAVTAPGGVSKLDVSEYLSFLAQQGLSGVTRARKLAAVRELFRFLVAHDYLNRSPAEGVETPKKERKGRGYLRPEEYSKLLALAGALPRDYAILQVFLQAGLRVSELCNLRLGDIDLEGHCLTVKAGKGQADRMIELEKKGIAALKSWLAVRPKSGSDHLFLDRYGAPFSCRRVQKLVDQYRREAGITKQISCHSLRHTFATAKAQAGVSPFQLKEWLGHQNLNTTQIYVHMARHNSRKVMEETSL
jgi:site-specific recombinase XerD